MACDFCNCLFLGCYDNCCDVPFIINNNPILATQTGTYTIQYIQEGSNAMVAAIDFTIGDEIKFPFSWFNFTGEVKFQLILPDNSVYEFNTYDCFSFQKVVTSTPSTSTSVTCNNVTVGEICTICDLLEALNIESQLLLEIRDINQTYLDTPLSELGKETTLQAILTAIGGFGGAYALESTLQLVLTQLGNLGLDSTLQSILSALGTGLAQETTLQTVAKETTLQSVLTQLTTLNGTDFATETTLQAVETAINNLPAGGGDATAANQVLEIAQLTSLNAKDFSTETTLQSVLAALLLSGQELTLQAILSALGPLATELTLGQVLTELQNQITLLTSIDGNVSSLIPYVTLLNSIDTYLSSINSNINMPIADIENTLQTINTSIGTSNGSLAGIALNTQIISSQLAEPTTSLITQITPITALNNGSESLISAFSDRKLLIIANNTNRTIYVAYGVTANTTTDYSFTIESNSFEKVEIGANLDLSFSIVQPTATGTINVTELN